jgi:hypothetical protein
MNPDLLMELMIFVGLPLVLVTLGFMVKEVYKRTGRIEAQLEQMKADLAGVRLHLTPPAYRS